MSLAPSSDAAPSPAVPGRLERRKARTRAAILDAATRLFQGQGFEETSIQQIAEAADTGVGTLYGYFASKDEVLREVLRVHTEAAIERYRASVDATTPHVERVTKALDNLAAYIQENRSILLAAFQTAVRANRFDDEPTEWLVQAFSRLVQAGIDAGDFRPVPVDATVRTLLGTYTMAMLGIGAWRGFEDDPATLEGLGTITRTLLLKNS